MKRLQFYMGLMALLGLVAITGCGSSSSSDSGGGSDDTPALDTIDDLPQATAPVTSADASLSAKVIANDPALATTGMVLGDTTADDFSADSSLAACEMVNMTKESVNQAVMGDLILCYIQQIYAATSGVTIEPVDPTVSSIDIYDGAYHTFTLVFPEGEDGEVDDGPDHVKFKINKSGDSITGLEMFACGSDVQNMYLNQDIDGADFSMTNTGVFSGGDCENGHTSTVTGTLDGDGDFVGTKTIAMSYSGECGENTFHGTSTMEQTADQWFICGGDGGTFSFDNSDGTYGVQACAAAQLLDGNAADTTTYDVGLLAVGDGTTNGVWAGSYNTDSWGEDFLESWSGDTTEPIDSADALVADYTTLATAATLPDIPDSVTISFTGDAEYDCGDDVEAVITITDEGIFNSCSNLELGHEWVNCYDIVVQDSSFQEEDSGSMGESCTANSDCSDLGASAVCSQNNCTISCTATSQCTAVFGSGFACTNSVCQPQ